MRKTNTQVTIDMVGRTIHRVVLGKRQFTNSVMGYILIEGKYNRVMFHENKWIEHPTDWRSYDTITEGRKFDNQYDIPYPDKPVEYIQGIGIM